MIVTYHDPGDLGRHSGIYEEPREMIKKFAPHFVEMEKTARMLTAVVLVEV